MCASAASQKLTASAAACFSAARSASRLASLSATGSPPAFTSTRSVAALARALSTDRASGPTADPSPISRRTRRRPTSTLYLNSHDAACAERRIRYRPGP